MSCDDTRCQRRDVFRQKASGTEENARFFVGTLDLLNVVGKIYIPNAGEKMVIYHGTMCKTITLNKPKVMGGVPFTEMFMFYSLSSRMHLTRLWKDSKTLNCLEILREDSPNTKHH